MNIDREVSYFKQQLKTHADPERAEGSKRYLKSPWKFYGVNTPTKRKMVKRWLKEHQEVKFDEMVKLGEALWNSRWHEEKTLAVMLLHQTSDRLTLKQMPLIEKMINEATGWDHLDEISIRLVGGLIDHDLRVLKYLPKWARSKNFWVRRVALLAQILQFRRKEGNKKLFFKLAVPMFDEGKDWSPEERFFIRKAIGWVLREIAQVEPEVAFEFLRQNKNSMSGLTFREGSRKLPTKLKGRLGS